MFPFLDPAPKRRRNTNPHNSVRRNLPRTPPPTPHTRTDRVGLVSRSSRRIPSWVLARRRDAWSLFFWGVSRSRFSVSRLTRPSARLYDCRGWWWGCTGPCAPWTSHTSARCGPRSGRCSPRLWVGGPKLVLSSRVRCGFDSAWWLLLLLTHVITAGIGTVRGRIRRLRLFLLLRLLFGPFRLRVLLLVLVLLLLRLATPCRRLCFAAR